MKFYLSILLCLVCLSCANQADQYIIRGSFPGLQDGMTVRLLNAETRNKDRAAACRRYREKRPALN